MDHIGTIGQIRLLKESGELECKTAGGRDGRGQLPDDFWPSYSAFANTRGGVIILGISEPKSGVFTISGITNPDKVIGEIFNLANNLQKISFNILSDDDVSVHKVDGKDIIAVRIRRATRKERPIYVGLNPLSGTYKRSHSGDRKCDSDIVRRMIAEQVEDTRDARIIRGFGIDALDIDTVRAYRQALRTARPGHIALELDDAEFLRFINAWKRDRESGIEGVTAAGLLMFGQLNEIWDVFPKFLVDYQEQNREYSNENRWIDRVTLDGTWSGNLYDFYRRAYRKLTSDIKIPFYLEGGQRKDETEIHIALREALVNSIIHADYSASSSVLIIKRPDMFTFRNPGHMRVPPEVARQGGEGDARNKLLQHMFFLVGASDRAGTGVPTIYRGWKERGWVPPSFAQIDVPSEQTKLELRMTDLLPTSIVERLSALFGEKIDMLTADQRLVLATAAGENIITNSRIQEICNIHRADITRMLQSLVKDGFLKQSGKTSGTYYYLPDQFKLDLDIDAFIDQLLEGGDISFEIVDAETGSAKSEGLGLKSEEQASKKGELEPKSEEHVGALRAALAEVLENVVGVKGQPIDKNEDLSHDDLLALHNKSARARSSGKLPLSEIKNIICNLCDERFMTAKFIAGVISRDERYVRDKLIAPLVAEGRLERAFPGKPSDPRQSYRISQSDKK